MARAWRPSLQCAYVIGEIHGNATSLEVIFNRILPLRKFKVSQDKIIMLGDYIDGHENGCKVIDMLLAIKAEYGDRVITLRGNHEELLIRAYKGTEDDFNTWMDAGGRITIGGYLNKIGSKSNPYSIVFNRIRDIIPKEHIEFLSNMPYHYIDEPYCFFHGGFNVKKPIAENTKESFIFDSSSTVYVKKCVRDNVPVEFLDAYTHVCAHGSKEPFIHPKLMTLGGTAPEKLIVMELNSGAINVVNAGKSRIYPLTQ